MKHNIFLRGFNKLKGFTLIELLVAVGIIALLTAVITANFSAAKAKSRDGKRISDIAQIQLALTYYFDRCNQYPLNLSLEADNGCVGNTNLGTFLGKYPTPPTQGTSRSTQRTYHYIVNSDSSPTDYLLIAHVENDGSVVQDGLTGATTLNSGMFYPSPQSDTFPPSSFSSPSSYNCGQSDGQGMYRYCVGSR